MYNNNKKFDIDLQFGQEGERWLVWLGTDQAKVEVKMERDKWMSTGNAIFEIESRGNPSGVYASEADYWAHLFRSGDKTVMAMVFQMQDLKDFITMVEAYPSFYNARQTMGGDLDDNGNPTSNLLLIPISQLYRIGNPYAKTN